MLSCIMVNLYGRKVVISPFSLNLCKRAKDLLEHAKRAVEIAIEQDEQTAIDWLESVDMPNSHLQSEC